MDNPIEVQMEKGRLGEIQMFTKPGLPMTRRTFLQAICVAFAAGFTAIADELDRLMRWCCRGSAPRLACAG